MRPSWPKLASLYQKIWQVNDLHVISKNKNKTKDNKKKQANKCCLLQ